MVTPDVPLTDAEIAELRRLEAATRADKGAAIDHMATAWNALPRLLAEVELARALLKRIEWAGVDADGYSRCPGCLGLDASDPGIAHWPLGAAPVGSAWKGHRPNCELAALISPR